MKTKFNIEYYTEWGESLCLESLDKRYPMQWQGDGKWSVTLDGVSSAMLEDYTYLVMRDGLIVRTEWTSHSSKRASVINDSWLDCPVEGCRFTGKHSAEIFDKPHFRGAGTAVPIFSLRSKDDFGIGEFNDLRPLVDWAARTGQCVIQLLPINDTTRKGEWGDSYPYSPISSFALHPLYIHLQDLGIKEDAAFKKTQKELNDLKEIDYPRVFKEKMSYLHKAFAQRGAKDLASSQFKRFLSDNISWIGEYSEFCSRRDGVQTEFYAWVQFHLDRQLSRQVEYAHRNGVYLKGDLPIGVSGDGADAYWHPELFNLDSSAGAPPDYFSADGQNWGFPTYNWYAMASDGYAWWKNRLRKMAEYFDAFRIDHILGFFRIWEIPADSQSGTEGHFNPALPYSAAEIGNVGLHIEGLFHEDPRNPGMYQPLIRPDSQELPPHLQEVFGAMYNDFFFHRNDGLWKREALRKLPELLGATGMLACGEDLGMVPDCVPGVMDSQRILSLKMRGMENEGEWKELSVCATSSHDMPTLRMQFTDDPECHECRRVLEQFLNSPSMLAIFPIQDWLSISPTLRNSDRNERINHPENPSHHWCYRLHLDVPSLADEPGFCTAVASIIKDSGR